MLKAITLALFVTLLFTGQACLAGEKNYFLELGLHTGGDQIPTEKMAPQHTGKIKAGNFVSVSLGGIIKLNQNLALSPSIGIQYFTNRLLLFEFDKTDWQITVLNLPILYRVYDWQIGAGLTYHYKPTLTASNRNENYKEKWEFDNSLGSIIKLDYYYNDEESIGLQYMQIDYTLAGYKTINGDNIALLWRIHFSL